MDPEFKDTSPGYKSTGYGSAAPSPMPRDARGFGRKFQHAVEKQSKESHLLGFSGWHFVDTALDFMKLWMDKKIARPLTKMAPLARAFAKWIPGIAVVSEAAHVSDQVRHAADDWQRGELSDAAFGGLMAFYSVYALSGAGGPLVVPVKEAIVTLMQQFPETFSPRYVPHTLVQEAQHWAKSFSTTAEASPQTRSDRALSVPHFHDGVTAEHCDTCRSHLGEMAAKPTPMASVPSRRKP